MQAKSQKTTFKLLINFNAGCAKNNGVICFVTGCAFTTLYTIAFSRCVFVGRAFAVVFFCSVAVCSLHFHRYSVQAYKLEARYQTHLQNNTCGRKSYTAKPKYTHIFACFKRAVLLYYAYQLNFLEQSSPHRRRPTSTSDNMNL